MMAPAGLRRVLDHARRSGSRYLLGPGFRRAEALCETTQWLSRARIAEAQWARLPAILEAANSTSALYRRRFAEVGWPVTPETFRRIPALTRRDLEMLGGGFSPGRRHRALQRSSGGSGGGAVAVALDRDTYGWYIAGTWRGLRWWGVEPTDRAVLLLGRSAGSPIHALAARAKDWMMNWRRIGVDDRFERTARAILRDIGNFGATFLYGYPSAVHRLAAAAASGTWRPRRRLRLVVLTGESLYGFQRNKIEAVFQCPVAEEYGSGELGCMAFECPRGRLHSTAESVLLEIAASPPAAADARGRILATHLQNRVFPLIRYEIGDVGAIDGDPCPCGRGLPTLRVLGRAHERGGGDPETAPSRPQLEQFFDMLPDHLQGRVRVARRPAGTVAFQVERDAASKADRAHAAAVGAEIFTSSRPVEIEELERLPRLPSGKLPYVVETPR